MAEGERGIEVAGLRVAQGAARACIDLRGDPRDARFVRAVESIVDLRVPVAPGSCAAGLLAQALWLGPDQWLIVTAVQEGASLSASLRASLRGIASAVTDVSCARIVYAVGGTCARDLLAKGCPLDLHERAFPAGRCAQTLLAKLPVLIHRGAAEPAFDLYIGRSYADYAWDWLRSAAAEYGAARETSL
jgi:sarcosine oxidase subunit gamma